MTVCLLEVGEIKNQKMKVHKNLFISGKVQGVFYRVSTQEAAIKLGLKGFVCNQPDGSVYAEVEGDEMAVFSLIEWCKTGPKFAKILEVRVEDGDFTDFVDFQVKR